MDIKVKKLESGLLSSSHLQLGEIYVVEEEDGYPYWKGTLVVGGTQQHIFLGNVQKSPAQLGQISWDSSEFKYRKLLPGEQIIIEGN